MLIPMLAPMLPSADFKGIGTPSRFVPKEEMDKSQPLQYQPAVACALHS